MTESEDILDEYWVLTTTEGSRLLGEVGPIRHPGPADLERWRKLATPGRVAASLRIAQTRRRGASKFFRAAEMWFDPTGLEQATAEPVARYKAFRFHEGLIVDLCGGIGGDALALAGRGAVISVDQDQGMGRRLLWNARVQGVSERVLAVTGDAARFHPPRGAWVHVDPDRRSGSPRAARADRLDGYRPGLDGLRRIIKNARDGAIKLGPASDFERAFGGPEFEIEVISLRGECKEATVWFGQAKTCLRRATRLPEGATWTDRDGPARLAETRKPLAWVFDPDPSLGRAGLLDGFALALGLKRVGQGVDLLTADAPIDSPFLARFAVIDVLPLDLKTLKREVASRGLGPLEIKTKGSALTPEEARARLRPPGDRPATVILVGGVSPGLAILAERPVIG